MPRRRSLPDNFTLALLGCVVPASLLPCRGEAARIFDVITDATIALLFFLHDAKLPGQAIVQGMRHCQPHLTVFAGAFVLFPLFGQLLRTSATRC